MDFFRNTCFKEHNNMAVARNLWATKNSYKNNVFQLSHLSKQAVPIKYTRGKKFFAAASFEDLSEVSFQTEYKNLIL